MRGFAFHAAEIEVAYRENVSEVKQAMLDAFAELRGTEHGAAILGDFDMQGVTAFRDSAVVVRGRIKTLPGSQWGAGRAYNELIQRIFDERGIALPRSAEHTSEHPSLMRISYAVFCLKQKRNTTITF